VPTFEIGLVGAGAISAGAYTAGVIDFMVQALDSWYAAKDTEQALPLPQKTVPPHDVTLSVLSGASAGGMTAAIAAAYLGSDQPSITTEEDARTHRGKNKLFDSWVEQIDIASLLEGQDVADAHDPVVSLLDASVLAAIADRDLAVTPRGTRRRYVAENLELLLTVTNLRGVPYAIKVTGDQPTTYDMSLHADYVHFRISESGSALPDRYVMRWEDFGASGQNPLLHTLGEPVFQDK
jgi:hypothetical protein